MVFQATPLLASENYSNHWALESIDLLLDKEIVTGDQNGDINPDNQISRAEFVTIINKTFSFTDKSESNFPDVKQNSWYYDQFSKAKNTNYIVGDENGYANPEKNITRAEVAVILTKVLKLDAKSDTSTFIDNSLFPDWALKSIIAVQENKLVSGYPDGSFKAGANITRAEAFTIIANIINAGMNNFNEILEDEKNLTGNVTPKPTSTPSHIQIESESDSEESASGSQIPTPVPSPTPTPTPTPPTDEDELDENINYNIDTDADGVFDTIEEIFGADITKKDSDGDGLDDGFELYSYTDMTLFDTNDNGTSDADEDFDGDGLTDIEEQLASSRPDIVDTDRDELSDYEEVKTYGTSPIKKDTDDDGLNDYDEILIGLNPNNPNQTAILLIVREHFLKLFQKTLSMNL